MILFQLKYCLFEGVCVCVIVCKKKNLFNTMIFFFFAGEKDFFPCFSSQFLLII